ncbi:hypothetical protein FNV43_RR19483 [Rhamnella rubrinervis]|uniref:Uncharacterized protein n=1 Tax=Rhamnella rubrinervis TaxID=2594499 RepID=A0A8K0GTC0_9ROSA|nr:hypothetical protein FNV43_RR19483 [Rhamnella rubrinervis]
MIRKKQRLVAEKRVLYLGVFSLRFLLCSCVIPVVLLASELSDVCGSYQELTCKEYCKMPANMRGPANHNYFFTSFPNPSITCSFVLDLKLTNQITKQSREFICNCHFFHLVDGFGKCLGYAVWSVVWSQRIPHARDTHAKSHDSSFTYPEHSLSHGIVLGITAILHILLCWVLVFKSKLGSRGAAVANSISYWLNALLIGHYIKFSSSCAKTRPGFSKKLCTKFLLFSKFLVLWLSCSGKVSFEQIGFKSWSFEPVVLLAGLLPNPKLQTSVLSICLNTFAMLWMVPFGLSAAVSTRVSNDLGGGQP